MMIYNDKSPSISGPFSVVAVGKYMFLNISTEIDFDFDAVQKAFSLLANLSTLLSRHGTQWGRKLGPLPASLNLVQCL